MINGESWREGDGWEQKRVPGIAPLFTSVSKVSKHMWITNLNLPLRGRRVPLLANSVYQFLKNCAWNELSMLRGTTF